MADNEADLGSVETTPMAESDLPQPQEHQKEEKEEEEQQQHQEPKQQQEGDQDQEEPTPQREIEKNPEKPSGQISFSIWPPSQRTREAVIKRLIETLSNPSLLSKRYGSIPADEAAALAGLIEQESFSAASDAASASLPGGDGMEILQAYSKEISKRMLDAVKSRSATDSSDPAMPDRDASKDPPVVAPGATEETSPVEDEA